MSELQVGQKIEVWELPEISRETLRAYAEASGDFNPIHLDEEVAKKMGLPGIIAHGMLVAGYISERARRFVEDESALATAVLRDFQFRFRSMTLLGDVVSVSGAVKQIAEGALVLDLQARNQRGEITTTGVATFLI